MSSRDSRETFSQPLLDGEGSESDFDKEWALPKAGARRRSYGVHFLIGALVLSLGLNVYQGASKYALPIEKAFTKSKYGQFTPLPSNDLRFVSVHRKCMLT